MTEVTHLDRCADKQILAQLEPPPVSPPAHEQRMCWICFDIEQGEPDSDWVKPCVCRGATQWVHKECIHRWIDEKMLQNPRGVPECPQCKTEYNILYPESGILFTVVDRLEAMQRGICPYAVGLLIGASAYWSVLSFGAFTLMQLLGRKEALGVLERVDPTIVAIGVPTIPFMMAAFRAIPWEDFVLNIMRRVSDNVQPLRVILPQPPQDARHGVEDQPEFDLTEMAGTICGVALLPTIAMFMGRVFFSSIKSNLRRALLGGGTFVLLKGIVTMYHKQKQMVRLEQRQIADYAPDLVQQSTDAEAAMPRYDVHQVQ